MKRLAVGAAVAERWLERSSGVRYGSDRKEPQKDVLVRRASRFSGETFRAVSATSQPSRQTASACVVKSSASSAVKP